MKRQCNDCEYWEHLEWSEVSDDEIGACHRHPPQAGDRSFNYPAGDIFPVTCSEDWCGEWKTKENTV